ncbi:hypothetical protein CFC57_10770 [Staphylococcus aureus]|nr:hypothetical protein CFC57_10770 [Staphylococcus aureus]
MFRLIGSGTEIIFNKIYFVLPQLTHYCKLTESQLLCWGPANLHCLLKLGIQLLFVGAHPNLHCL